MHRAWSEFLLFLFFTKTKNKRKALCKISLRIEHISLFKGSFEDKCHQSLTFFGFILMFQSKTVIADLIFRGEVTEKGNVWNLPEAAAYVTFHEGAVPKPLLFTCSVWPPKLRSPPISSDELLVSNVIELSHDGPPDLELSGDDEGNVTVALLHSATDLKGYEVVIKQLVDPYDNVWKDLETWHASGAGYMSFMMIVSELLDSIANPIPTYKL